VIPLVDAIPPVRGRRARPRRRPKRLHGDRAYHSGEGRCELRRRRIQARIAAPKTPHGSGLGKQRFVVERTIAWLHQYRRLRVRYERRDRRSFRALHRHFRNWLVVQKRHRLRRPFANAQGRELLFPPAQWREAVAGITA
jgi:transposase